MPTEWVRAAHAGGIELEPGKVTSWLFSTELRDSRFRLAGVRDLIGTVRRLSVGSSGLSPARVKVEDVALSHTGSALGLVKDWSAWHARFSARLGRDLPFEPPHVRWTLTRKWGPPVLLSSVSSEPLPDGTLVGSADIAVATLGWPSLEFRVEPRTQGLDIGFGSKEYKTARTRLVYFDTPEGETVNLSVRRAPLGENLECVGLSLGRERLRQMLLQGSLSLNVPRDAQQLRGSLQFTVDNLVQPRLADSAVLFGSTASLLMRFETDASLSALRLPYALFNLPPFKLEGNGQLDVEGSNLHLRLELSGNRSCGVLAQLLFDPATRARIQTQTAPGQEAPPPEVNVRLQVDLRTDRLDQAAFAWQIGAGCGLPVLANDPVLALSLPPFEPPQRRQNPR
jgi:hypothetical protein